MAVVIEVDGIELGTPGTPNPLPTPDRPARIKAYYMRRGATGAGFRCIRRLGTHASYTDFRFPCGFLNAAQVAQLQTKHDNQTPFALVIDGTAYTVIFAEGGFKTTPFKWLDYTWFRADVHLHVLSQGG